MENSDIQMTISFNNEDDSQHCYETNGANTVVQVLPRTGNSRGSSMVKLKNIIGYKWPQKNYAGHLIAIHKEGKIIAYSINVNGQGMVRLIHFGLGNKRALIKGMSKEVLDLQFADYSEQIIIGCIEETALHVHRLEVDAAESMNCVLLLKIENPILDHVPTLDKISWCPYVPEENDTVDEFSVMLLVWVRGNKFECYSVKTILDTYKAGIHQAANIKEGLVKSYEDDRSLITHATYSPDGTTLAISTADGYIRFYQIYFHEATPRCLHVWSPHDGESISSFFFLDNHTQPIAGSALWKYAVTLAANNTEIKVSKCDNWKTLQTISFKSTTAKPLAFKAEIDRTSSYLILSDMSNRQMYVLQILKENALGQQNGSDEHKNGDEGAVGGIARVFVKSIAEFPLASSILSYGISNASIRRYKCALSDNYLIDELEDYDEENNSLYCVVLRLFMILPESVQECHILYQPASDETEEVNNKVEKPLALLNVSATSTVDAKADSLYVTPPSIPAQINLLTPDSFSSPIDKSKDVSQEVLSQIFMLAKTSQAAPGSNVKAHESIINLTNCSLLEEEKIFQQKLPVENNGTSQAKSGAASGGSSPSREVRDILLKADSVNEDYYPGEDSDDLENDIDKSKEVFNALNALNVEFKNIDDEDETADEGDGNEEDYEDEEPAIKETLSNPAEWPQAPQFIDPASAPATSKQVETLSSRMNQMIEIMETQSRYIAELRHEIYSLKGKSNADTMVTQTNLEKVEKNCKQAIDQSHVKYETSLMLRDKSQRELSENIAHMVKQMSLNQKAAIEMAMKENMMRICTHHSFIDSLTQSVVMGLQKSLEKTFKKSLEEVLVPAYEKISQEMFHQLAASFNSGTKEYTRAFDTYMKQYGAVQFQMTEFSGAIHKIPQAVLHSNEQTLIPAFNTIFLEFRDRMDKTQMKLIGQMMEQVKAEIKSGFERQTMTLEDSVLSVVQRSQTETPAPTIYDQQENIRQLLAHGEVNKAFHQALISSDLTLLEFTLEKADINKVFSPCPLEQTVLMSLIQQLTADMSKYSELKNSYLNDAILALVLNDPITKEHAPKILRELYNTFQSYIRANPNTSFSSSMRMTLMVTQSILKQSTNNM